MGMYEIHDAWIQYIYQHCFVIQCFNKKNFYYNGTNFLFFKFTNFIYIEYLLPLIYVDGLLSWGRVCFKSELMNWISF